MTLWQKIAIAGLLLCAALGGYGAWLMRYEVIPVRGGATAGEAYYLDRWTGVVYWMRGAVIYPVQPKLDAGQ